MIHCRDYRVIFPLTVAEIRSFMLRLEDGPNRCWLWTGHIGSGGYGRAFIRGSFWQAHRMAYEIFVGPVPTNYFLHHRCHNTRCCNPEHLKPVPQEANLSSDNVIRDPDRPKRLKLRCKHGHEFTEANTKWSVKNGKRYRVCRICDAVRSKRRNERRRLKRAAAVALRRAASAAQQPRPYEGEGPSSPQPS